MLLTLKLQHHITQVCLNVELIIRGQYQTQTEDGSISSGKRMIRK